MRKTNLRILQYLMELKLSSCVSDDKYSSKERFIGNIRVIPY
jgi:hypothetical protein